MTTIETDIGIDLDMTVGEHIATALLFLGQSEREFGAGDTLQGSEKLWGATVHAVLAIALEKDWPCGSHHSLKAAAGRLAEQNDDKSVSLAFSVAEKFHANFYHGFMQSYQLDADIPRVREFVEELVSMAQNSAKE